MSKSGRPTIYTKELAEEICRKVAESNCGLSKLCEQNPHLPTASTIWAWISEKPGFSEQYKKAKVNQMDVLTDQIIEIADNMDTDVQIVDGKVVTNYEHIARSRLRIDTRKWLASKLAPKIYGERAKEGESETLSLMQKVIDKL